MSWLLEPNNDVGQGLTVMYVILKIYYFEKHIGKRKKKKKKEEKKKKKKIFATFNSSDQATFTTNLAG